jgi:hypothetical protein
VDDHGKAVPWPLRAPVRAWLWARETDAEAVPRPVDVADQRLPGPDPLNVLLVGAGAALGWGVLSHALGLSGALARRLRGETERGVVLRSRTGMEITAETAADVVLRSRTPLDDIRVVVLGITETFAMMPPTSWEQNLTRLLNALEPTASRPAVLSGIQPISAIPIYRGGLAPVLDRHAAALNQVTAELCAATPHTAFAPLSTPPAGMLARFRGPADYDFWAEQLVTRIAPLVPPPGAHAPSSRLDAELERRRQAELDRLGIRGRRAGFAVDDIVQFSRSVFRAQSAELMILDGDRAWALSSDGTEPHDIGREHSFTSYATDARGTFVVEDASRDVRFRDYAYVTGDPRIRFFAGHPIEGPSGDRIGALCVYDPEPRRFDEAERALLRTLAGRLETALGRQR